VNIPCPTCGGAGTVPMPMPPGAYGFGQWPRETCRTCWGAGSVWQQDVVPPRPVWWSPWSGPFYPPLPMPQAPYQPEVVSVVPNVIAYGVP
jgi:hypothetical protein